MRTGTTRLIGLILWGSAGLSVGAPALPSGLAPALEAGRYAIAVQGEDHVALNPVQRQRIAFRDGGVEVAALPVPPRPIAPRRTPESDPRPLPETDPQAAPGGQADATSTADWRFGFRLTAYGSSGALQPVAEAEPQVTGARLEYRRGPITEWYENRPVGLEQGFTLHRPPHPEATDLVLSLTVQGDLQADWQTPGQALRFRTKDGHDVLNYSELKVIDAADRELPARLALTDPTRLEIHVDLRGAVWPVVVDPLIVSLQAELTASDAAAGDWFGSSVALDGDTALIARGRDPESGYIFVRTGSTWTQQAQLRLNEYPEGISFINPVAISGDTALLGAALGGCSGSDACTRLTEGEFTDSVHVFVRNGDTWTRQATLFPSNACPPPHRCAFASELAVDGDTVLVGADREDQYVGAAYVYQRRNGSWFQQARLTAADGAEWDYFGSSVALDGDTALVGAHHSSDSGDGYAAAYVFHRTGETWVQQAKLTAADDTPWNRFGTSVALFADTALVGAEYADGRVTESGAAYVFTRTGSTWRQQGKLTAADGETWDGFGTRVALSGNTALIGNIPSSGSGAAYVFTRTGDVWTQQAKLHAPDTVEDRYFSEVEVALSNDTALIGDYGSFDQPGAAYVYTLTGGPHPNPYARQVQQMYVAYYGRPGDGGGVDYWAGRLAEEGGNWISDLVNAFGTSAEYTVRFGGLSNPDLIDNLYSQLFNRAAEPAGRGFYIDLLGGSNQSGLNPSRRQSTLAQIALDIANGAQNADAVILQHKLDVSTYFTERVRATGTAYTAQDITHVAGILALVDESDDSVFVARSQVNDFVN